MVEAAENRIGDNVPEPLDRTSTGRVLPKRNVGSHLIIIARVFGKDSPKVVCTENSNSNITVMQSAKDRVAMDTSSSLNWARERRVLI
jgi:hypothetical protein